MSTIEYINSTNFKDYSKFYQENNLALDDDIIMVQDIGAEDMVKMDKLETLSKKIYPTEAEKLEITQLKTELINYMPNPYMWNKLGGMVYGMQVYLKEGVVIFINQQKQELIELMNQRKYTGVFALITTYAQGNMVMYDGYGFVSKVDGNIGHAPNKDVIEDDYWIRFTIKGEKGDPSLNISIKKGTDGVSSDFDPLQTYNVGDACIFDNRLYYCIVDGTIGIATTDNTKWACADKIWISASEPTDTHVIWWDKNDDTMKIHVDNGTWKPQTLNGKTATGSLLTNAKISLVEAINELKTKIDTVDNKIIEIKDDVVDIYNQLDTKIATSNYVRTNNYSITGGTNIAYTITLSPAPISYNDGMTITVVPHVNSGANPTINVNNLGALQIKNSDGDLLVANDWKAGIPVILVRVGSYFFIRASRKNYGNSDDTTPSAITTIPSNSTSITLNDSIVKIVGILNKEQVYCTMKSGKLILLTIKNGSIKEILPSFSNSSDNYMRKWNNDYIISGTNIYDNSLNILKSFPEFNEKIIISPDGNLYGYTKVFIETKEIAGSYFTSYYIDIYKINIASSTDITYSLLYRLPNFYYDSVNIESIYNNKIYICTPGLDYWHNTSMDRFIKIDMNITPISSTTIGSVDISNNSTHSGGMWSSVYPSQSNHRLITITLYENWAYTSKKDQERDGIELYDVVADKTLYYWDSGKVSNSNAPTIARNIGGGLTNSTLDVTSYGLNGLDNGVWTNRLITMPLNPLAMTSKYLVTKNATGYNYTILY